MKRLSKGKKTVLFIGILLIMFLVYEYIILRCLALNKFKSYIAEQGIEESLIDKKEVYKDWVQGGYSIIVYYSDNPGYQYCYSYELRTHRRGEDVRYNRMFLKIVDIDESLVLDPPYGENVKHKPLDGE